MKRIAMAAPAALLLLGSVHAQQMPPFTTSALYGELGYTFLKIDAFGTSTRPDALRAIIGYDMHPFFAVEGMGAWGVNDDTKDLVTGKVEYMYGLWLKPKYNITPQAEVFGRLGWNHNKFKATGPGIDRSETRDDLAWGIGANYRFTPQWYAGVDWMRYSNQSNTHADGLTLSVGYHW